MIDRAKKNHTNESFGGGKIRKEGENAKVIAREQN